VRFLEKHYEKLILAVSLLIFIISLVYLIIVFSQRMEITDKDLQLKINEPDYVSVFDATGNEIAQDGKKKYDFFNILKKEDRWSKSKNKGGKIPVTTDLMVPFKAARCFHCKQIIPLVYFDKEEDCILCHKSLHKIKTKSSKDVDRDGMNDDWEKKYGLLPMDPKDKMEDKDEDGFPNFVEFKSVPQTEPNNPLSHPNLADRIFLKGFKRIKIQVTLKNVMKNGSEKKSDWLVHLKLKKKGKWRTAFHKIGDEIKIGSDIYKIQDVDFKMKDIFNPKLRQPVPTNISTIVIDKVGAKKSSPITVKINKPVYENLIKVIFCDFITDKKFVAYVGGKLAVGDETVGISNYIVKSIDPQNYTATIVTDDEKKKEFKIGKESVLEQILDDLNGNEVSPDQEIPRNIKKND